MKILMIGHSLGMDATYMLPDVARNEGMEDLIVGVLYHSGCRLGQHVKYLTENAPQYAYLEYDISADNCWRIADCNGNFVAHKPNQAHDIYIDDGSIGQTMAFGITRHAWDIVVMQAGLFESANVGEGPYLLDNVANIHTIQRYVLDNYIEPGKTPKFAWNMVWGPPGDEAKLTDTTKKRLYDNFGGSIDTMYKKVAQVLKEEIMPCHDWEYLFPSATMMHNLNSSYLEPKDLYRDYAHASDFVRVSVAYLWYCTLTGTKLEACKFAPISSRMRFKTVLRESGEPLELTQQEKLLLIESVGNAMAEPYAMTQSRYTG